MPDQTQRQQLSVTDGVLLITGLVIGTSILRAPSSIAAQTSGPAAMMWAWALGGLLALCGSYCYTRLARAYPGNGGEYTYLRGSLGPAVAFLFAWARMTVLQTGSIAATAFVYGDYVSKLWPLGPYSSLWHAGGAVVGLTVLNACGLHLGKTAQNVLTIAKVGGLVAVCLAGVLLGGPSGPATHAGAPAHPAFGLAMVFVLYAYGGWNEASYLGADVTRGPRGLAAVLLISTLGIWATYALINIAYLRALGFEGLRESTAPASDVVSLVCGKAGGVLVAALSAVIALGSANATTFTGSRAIQALGLTHGSLRWLSSSHRTRRTPLNAFLVQGVVATALVLVAGLLGDSGRHGFEVAVEYTAPAYWGFMALIGLVALGMGVRHQGRAAGRVGLLVAAGAFSLVCGYMLYSSIVYAGAGAMLGLAIVATGLPVYALVRALDARGRLSDAEVAGTH